MRTFDIFDTLIARRCVTPEAIFQIVEKEMGLTGFTRVRRQAEKAISRGEYTLNDIYAEVVRMGFCSFEVGKALENAEIATEIDQVIGIRENLDKVSDGDILITDMYLPRPVIEALLAKVGLGKKVAIVPIRLSQTPARCSVAP